MNLFHRIPIPLALVFNQSVLINIYTSVILTRPWIKVFVFSLCKWIAIRIDIFEIDNFYLTETEKEMFSCSFNPFNYLNKLIIIMLTSFVACSVQFNSIIPMINSKAKFYSYKNIIVRNHATIFYVHIIQKIK